MDPAGGSRHLEIVLLHELSAGTFARLYLAEARAPGGIERIVAVKILREQWNESADVIARTRDEARLLARLRHKNIVRVEDLTALDGQLAIIMEFVDGLDLKQLQDALVARGTRIGPRAALMIGAAAASALEAAYFRAPYGLDAPLHVVHRDIKPSNIMISVEGEVKVLDFGTARSTQALRSAQTGALRFGSLKYMSPERREGDRGEHAADVYALGLTLVEILRGEWTQLLPLDAAEHDEAVLTMVNGLPPLGMPNREWDLALRQALLQMLTADAAARPNAEQVARLLRAFADQAGGETLESFAAERVLPATRQLRGNLSGGQLAGTRFVVNVGDSGGRMSTVDAVGPATPPIAQRLPTPGAADPFEDAKTTVDGAAPGGFEPPHPRPTDVPTAPQKTVFPHINPGSEPPLRPSYARPPAPPAQQAPSPQHSPPQHAPMPTHVPAAAEPRAAEGDRRRVERSPRREPSVAIPRRGAQRGADDRDPFADDPPKPTSPLVYAGVAAGVVVALLCLGVLGAGAAVWATWSGASPAPAVAAPSGAPDPSRAAAASAGAASGGANAAPGVGFTVAVDGAVQWIRVNDPAGVQVANGRESLSTTLAAGSYDLAVKLVGRPPLKARVELPPAGAALTCGAREDGKVACAGLSPAVLLVP